jgi:hypothetical protein
MSKIVYSKTPYPTHCKVLVRDVPVDGKLTSAEGHIFSFPLSLWDAQTIPLLPWTIVQVSYSYGDCQPIIWRMGTEDRDVVLELEGYSDAGTASMQNEARNCWSQLVVGVKKRIEWLNLIGVHKDSQARASSGIDCYRIMVRTLQDDFLARAFAQGSADVAFQIERLVKEVGLSKNISEHNSNVSADEFFWGDPLIPAWAAGRYAEALNNNFKTVQATFSKPE